jgi:hypothetical protein
MVPVVAPAVVSVRNGGTAGLGVTCALPTPLSVKSNAITEVKTSPLGPIT